MGSAQSTTGKETVSSSSSCKNVASSGSFSGNQCPEKHRNEKSITKESNVEHHGCPRKQSNDVVDSGGNRSKTSTHSQVVENHDDQRHHQQQENQNLGESVAHGVAKTAMHGSCPLKKNQRVQKVYNVYGQEIDPSNRMPYNPNQEPNERQKFPLDTERVHSSIPKGGVDETWVYPSPQMFFNSLCRKGKDDNIHEGFIESVVAIHNNMNELTWKRVVEWEKSMHPNSEPRLLRFMGRPDDVSPIARIKMLFGKSAPFDRHDWIVLRKDGSEVRYVIDYYYDEEKSKDDVFPSLESTDAIKSISIFARPAVDTFESVLHRIWFPIKETILQQQQPLENPSLLQNPSSSSEKTSTTQVEQQLDRKTVHETFSIIQNKCQQRLLALRECQSSEECTKAATSLQYCMGSILCKKEIEEFDQWLKKGDEQKATVSFEKVTSCIEQFERVASLVMQQDAQQAAQQTAQQVAQQVAQKAVNEP